ncbi:hypothetical protein VPH35_042458 [Triticum aestivum]
MGVSTFTVLLKHIWEYYLPGYMTGPKASEMETKATNLQLACVMLTIWVSTGGMQKSYDAANIMSCKKASIATTVPVHKYFCLYSHVCCCFLIFRSFPHATKLTTCSLCSQILIRCFRYFNTDYMQSLYA